MNTSKFTGKTRVAGLIAVGLVTLLLLSSCATQPTVNVEATAQSLARLWVAQTAEAQSVAQAAPSATDTPVPAASTPPATEIPVNTDTPTVIPTPTIMPTRPPATAAAASPVPVPTSDPAVACPVAADPELAAGWDRAKLGCPTARAAVIWAAWEPFQRGNMFWRSDLDWTYALHQRNGTDSAFGEWSTGKDAWRWDESFPEGRGLKPPPGLLEPIRGFGYTWYNFLGGPDSALGWATGQEKGFCANLQPFEHGVIFHSSTIQFCQDQMYNWAAEDPSFTPLFFTLYTDGNWERH